MRKQYSPHNFIAWNWDVRVCAICLRPESEHKKINMKKPILKEVNSTSMLWGKLRDHIKQLESENAKLKEILEFTLDVFENGMPYSIKNVCVDLIKEIKETLNSSK